MRRVKKSRNGCARCKSKRVKCGEEKPHCSRCTRLGVKCPGYVQSLRWVTNYPESAVEGQTKPGESSFKSTQSPSPRHVSPSGPSEFANIDLTTPSHLSESRDQQGNESDALCENLWTLPQDDSLPELADLCPSAARADQDQHAGSVFEFASLDQADNPLSLFSVAQTSQQESHSFPGFSPSAIVRKFPPSGGHQPHRDLTSIPQPLNNPSWTLIEYYFKEVAALFSSYDSQMNPFRTTVSRLWGSSLAMCKTMQSMAAATLVNDFPQFGPLGKKMRDEAVNIITKEPTMDDKSLLALLMLGQTASWHDPKDLGISFYNMLRSHLDAKPFDGLVPGRGNNHQFFEESLVYWEMLLSFVADDASVLCGTSATGRGESLVLQRVPHPWTGIARDTQSTVQEVGRLVRRERKRIRSRRFTSHVDITRAQKAIEKARELEERLLALAHPAEAEIVSPGDDETPVWHLLTMAEVYRCTGLMQLYRVFPDLLHRRLPSQQHHPSTQDYQSSPTMPPPRDPFFETTSWLDDFSELPPHPTPEEPNPSPTPTTASSPDITSYHNAWLTEFALATLSRLKTIPLESRTRCLQPFLLVAASSELLLPKSNPIPTSHSFSTDQPPRTPDPALPPEQALNPDQGAERGAESESENAPNISAHAIEVSRTRRFILGRLTSFLHVLPPKPISVCLKLVREVWRRMDAGDRGVYWMDVMIENGWETTMG